MQRIDPEELAEAHWEYVESVLRNLWETLYDSPPLEAYMKFAGHHYKTAFIHGFKHGSEAQNEWSTGEDLYS